MNHTAILSDCQRFRYRLSRHWGGGPYLLFVMLNPSTTDGEVDDATIRRCIGFAQRAGYGGFDVVNLYAYRATKPRELRLAGYPVGADNDKHILNAATACAAYCLAWGANAHELERPSQVLPLLRQTGKPIFCLRITSKGQPEHPLMLPSSCVLTPFTLDAISEAMAKK